MSFVLCHIKCELSRAMLDRPCPSLIQVAVTEPKAQFSNASTVYELRNLTNVKRIGLLFIQSKNMQNYII